MADFFYQLLGDPIIGEHTATGIGFSNFSLDASTDKVGAIFAPETEDAITHVGYRLDSVTGTVTNLYKIGLQGIDASGLPDGTYKGGGTPASATITPSGTNAWRWVALDNSYTPSMPEVLALVLEYSGSGTINGSNFASVTQSISSVARYDFPCSLSSTGLWAKLAGVPPCFGYRTANGRFGHIIQSETTRTAGTNGHRVAMKFTVPSGCADTFKISAAKIFFAAATGGSIILGLWDTAGTAIQSATYDSDVPASAAGRWVRLPFDPSTVTALTAGTSYYLGLERSGANLDLSTAVMAEADDLQAWPGGTSWIAGTWNGSAWTDIATERPFMQPVVSDITEPAGGGGGIIGVIGE